jgi:hypothetical protein
MALTAKQAQCLAYGLPALAVAIALGAAFRPALMQAQQQTGNTEQNRQLKAIGQDIIAKRCYTVARPPIKGEPIDIPVSSLHSSCVSGAGWYGFLAVLDGRSTVIEVYTQVQIDNILSVLKKEGK